MNTTLIKAILGSIAGTLVMSLMVGFATSLMVEQPMDIAAMISNSYTVGMAAHIMFNAHVFPAQIKNRHQQETALANSRLISTDEQLARPPYNKAPKA
jgi:hypothetical protein